MKAIKPLLIALVILLLLSQVYVFIVDPVLHNNNEPDYDLHTCDECGKETPAAIETDYAAYICPDCFTKYGYKHCSRCGYAYKKYDYAPIENYCSHCADNNPICSFCGKQHIQENILCVDTLDGFEEEFYICLDCIYKYLTEDEKNQLVLSMLKNKE